MSAQFQKPNRSVVTVVTATTPVQLSAIFARSMIFQAKADNTGNVYFGDSSANAKVANGHALAPGESFSINGDNFSGRNLQIDLSDFWFDADTSGNKIIVTYFTETLNQ